MSLLTVTDENKNQRAFNVSARTLLIGLVFPMAQLILEQLGVLSETGQAVGSVVAVTALLLLGGSAFIQYRVLVSRAEEMWLDQQRFQEQMRTGEQDLRLLVAENTVAEAKRAARHKFEGVFRSCPLPMAINAYDDSRFIEVNPAFEKLVGETRQALVGHSPDELALWPEAEALRLRRRLAVRNLIDRLRLRITPPNAEESIVLLSTQRIELGGRPALISILRDVTQTWEGSASLRLPADLLRRAAVPIFHVDGAERIVYSNQAAADRLALSQAEIQGRPFAAAVNLESTTIAQAFTGVDRNGTWQGAVGLTDGGEISLWGCRLGDGPERLFFLV